MKVKKILMAGILSAVMAFSLAATAVPAITVEAAAKGPKTGDESYAHIAIGDMDSDDYGQWFLYRSDTLKETGEEMPSYEGSDVTYSQKTNTLTFKNFKHPAYAITVNQMGDDFKIVLKGTNQVQNLCVYGDNYGGSVTIKGSGTLTCNKNKKSKIYGAGLVLGAENTSSKLVIAKTCTVTSFGNKYTGYVQDSDGNYVEKELAGHPIYVFASKVKAPGKVIKPAGTVTGGKYKSTKSSMSGCYDIYCTASKFVSKKK